MSDYNRLKNRLLDKELAEAMEAEKDEAIYWLGTIGCHGEITEREIFIARMALYEIRRYRGYLIKI